MQRRALIVAMLVYASGASAWDGIGDYVSKYLSGSESPDAQVLSLFASYQAKPGSSTLAQIQSLASYKEAPLAKNILGCIYYNGIGVPANRDYAARLFQEASNKNLLAAGNYALSQIQSGNANGVQLLQKTFAQSGYESQGTQLFLAQLRSNQVDTKLLDRLVANKEPLGLYYRAYLLYQSGNYHEALKGALDAAEHGSASAPSLVASCYREIDKAVPNPANKENAEMWFYVDLLIKNPEATEGSLSNPSAYRQASFWIQNHRIKKSDYNQAVCINPGRNI